MYEKAYNFGDSGNDNAPFSVYVPTFKKVIDYEVFMRNIGMNNADIIELHKKILEGFKRVSDVYHVNSRPWRRAMDKAKEGMGLDFANLDNPYLRIAGDTSNSREKIKAFKDAGIGVNKNYFRADTFSYLIDLMNLKLLYDQELAKLTSGSSGGGKKKKKRKTRKNRNKQKSLRVKKPKLKIHSKNKRLTRKNKKNSGNKKTRKTRKKDN